jgi:GAF domain-containing protein
VAHDLNTAYVAQGAAAIHHSHLLLQPIVDTARAVFGAASSSIFVLDRHDDTLVFGAVSGAGEESLVGRRFPSSTGVAGFVAQSRQEILLDDLSSNQMFSREAAESTGYVPTGLMAAPLLFDEECVGVLEVLDATEGSRGDLADLALLGLLASQAAAAVALLQRSHWELAQFDDSPGGGLCMEIVNSLSGLSGYELDARLDVLRSVARMFRGTES